MWGISVYEIEHIESLMDDTKSVAEAERFWAEQCAQEVAKQAAREGKIAPQTNKATWIKLRQLKRIAEVKAQKPTKYKGRPRGTQLTPEHIEKIRQYLEQRAAEIRVYVEPGYEETWNEIGDNARRHNNNVRRAMFRKEWLWVCRQYNVSWSKLRRVLGTNFVDMLALLPGSYRLTVNRQRHTCERLRREAAERQNKKTSPRE